MRDFTIFIQARMSSSRLPGKMLAPLAGKPVITHIIDRLTEADLRDRIVVLTSTHPSDTPLALYVQQEMAVPVFRGDLDNVAQRFQSALKEYPTSWFIRICGDSPVLDGALVAYMAEQIADNYDMISNVWARSFPPGQSVECIRSDCYLALDADALSPNEKEHVTPYFYAHPEQYRICRVSCTDPEAVSRSTVLDTLEDYTRLEQFLAQAPLTLPSYAPLARLEP